MVFGGTVFYPYYRPGDALWHISQIADQVAAGGVMMVEESFLTIGLFCWLFLQRRAARDEERQALLDYADQHGLSLDESRAQRAVAAGRGQELMERLRRRRYLTVIVPTMPAARWPGTVQKNVYLPGLRLALTVEVPPPDTILPTWLTPAPLIAMSCGVEDLFIMLIVTWPGVAVALEARILELTRRIGVDLQLAGLLDGRLLIDGRHGAGQRPGVLSGPRGDEPDVGRDVLRVLAGEDAGGHHPLRVRVLDPVRDQALDRRTLRHRRRQRSWRKASSRLGPVIPAEPACDSVWQEAQPLTNSTLPCVTLATGCFTAQPPSATTAALMNSAATVRRVPPVNRAKALSIRSGGDSIPEGGTSALWVALCSRQGRAGRPVARPACRPGRW